MSLKHLFSFVGMVLLLFSDLIGQERFPTKSKKALEYYLEADNYRVQGFYFKAIENYKKSIAKDKKFYLAYYHLALLTKNTGDFANAVLLLNKVLELSNKTFYQSYYVLADLYIKIGHYDEAKKNLKKFLSYPKKNEKQHIKALAMLANIEFVRNNPNRIENDFDPKPLNDKINAFPIQYFPIVSVDEKYLIYTRRLGIQPQFDEDLVISKKDSTNEWLPSISISKNINSIYNEGTSTMSADGKTIIFTSCNRPKGIGSCDLYSSKKVGKNWSIPINMGEPINSKKWESQPSISADGRTLYFVSNREGGYGGRDIWMTKRSDNNSWSTPINMGSVINTKLDDTSPFIHYNNKVIYYSSEGLPGYGGFDIYYSHYDSVWQKPINLGSPINNGNDQYSLFITASGKEAYYSAGKYGYDSHRKIYKFEFDKINKLKYKVSWVEGVVRDSKTNNPIESTIELYDLVTNKRVGLVKSDSITGKYLMVLTEGSLYGLYVQSKGYLYKSYNFSFEFGKELEPIHQDIVLDSISKQAKTTLKNLYFKTNEFELNDLSLVELNKLSHFISHYTNVIIEVSGHTDSIGDEAFNLELSYKRAKSVYDYLIKQGISPKRLIINGYGSTQPIATNHTVDGRQSNRRIEIKIILK